MEFKLFIVQEVMLADANTHNFPAITQAITYSP